MKHTLTDYSVHDLVEQFRRNALLVNPDYQRGAVWTPRQQGKFLDSVLRDYPVPAVFLRAVEHEGLRGTHSTFELIDGQQRLRALRDFLDDKLRLPLLAGPDRLRLPARIAAQPVAWTGRVHSELPVADRKRLGETKLRVFVVEHPTTDDEVRDLFIRLQAGTALTRQQVRDAWPGPIAPFVESIGGKGPRPATSDLLSMVDKRGDRSTDEDARDPWVAHRQTCAQFLSVFLARERDPYARPRISADDLDELYHEISDFDRSGEPAQRFREALTATERVFALAARQHDGKKNKWKKLQIFSVFTVVQDIPKSPLVALGDENLQRLADIVVQQQQDAPLQGRARFAAGPLAQTSDALREQFFRAAGRFDSRRAFQPEQRAALRKAADGLCQICKKAVVEADAEYDHYPVPWSMCGPTEVSNGRLVHSGCHPRGRPRKADA